MTENQVQTVCSVKLDSPQDRWIFSPTMEEIRFRCINQKRGSAFFSQWDASRSHCLCCLGSRTGKQQSWGCLIANLQCLQESCKGIICFLEMKSTEFIKAASCVALHVRLTFPNVHPLSQGSISTASTHQQHAVWGTEWLASSKASLPGLPHTCQVSPCLHLQLPLQWPEMALSELGAQKELARLQGRPVGHVMPINCWPNLERSFFPAFYLVLYATLFNGLIDHVGSFVRWLF